MYIFSFFILNGNIGSLFLVFCILDINVCFFRMSVVYFNSMLLVKFIFCNLLIKNILVFYFLFWFKCI